MDANIGNPYLGSGILLLCRKGIRINRILPKCNDHNLIIAQVHNGNNKSLILINEKYNDSDIIVYADLNIDSKSNKLEKFREKLR